VVDALEIALWRRGPGEAVRIAIDFSHGFEGEQLYLFHCHILEHEDSGMMFNVKVVEP
jgi:blue copper oxidase